MNGKSEIILNILNIHEMLRSPVSSYRTRSLKSDAEEFIVEEAESLPRKSPIHLKIYLAQSEADHIHDIGPAIHRHFGYRRDQAQKKYKRTLRYGWKILIIAFALLAVIYSLTEITLQRMPENRIVLFIRESFIIVGWVALWRPLELLLYDWYPIKTNIRIYNRLEQSTVQIIIKES